MTAPASATTETARVAYWHCPACDWFTYWPERDRDHRRVAEHIEALVEAHEARHGIGAA